MRAQVGIDERGWYIEIRSDSMTEFSMLKHVEKALGIQVDASSGAAWLRQPACPHEGCARWAGHPEMCIRYDGTVILRKRNDHQSPA